jgi:hypothetical protein
MLRSGLAAATASGAALPLPRSARVAAVAGALVLGIAVAHSAALVLALCALPVLFVLVGARPEWVLILFLTAGIYKQDPRVTSILPFDVTVVLGVLLVLALVLHAVRRPVRFPAQGLLLVPLIVMLVHGLLGRAPDYGHEKALRFCTLTLLAILASGVLFAERTDMRRFFFALAAIGFVLCFDALSQRNMTSEGRLTGFGSNPIPLGRISALTLAYGWVRFHFAQKPFDKALYAAVLAVSCACVLGAGSRGPVLSILAGMALISVYTSAHHRRSPIGMTTLLLVAGFVTVAILFASIPSLPLHRFQLLFSEDKGTSVLLRGMLMATAYKLMLAHPFGIGVGGFARHAVLDLHYPHNLFLEVGCELGWIPLVALMALIAWSIRTLFNILRREYSWPSVYLALVVLVSAMNSMVTGDLNDNRVLFAVLLLPFAYRRGMDARPGTRGGVPRPDVDRGSSG